MSWGWLELVKCSNAAWQQHLEVTYKLVVSSCDKAASIVQAMARCPLHLHNPGSCKCSELQTARPQIDNVFFVLTEELVVGLRQMHTDIIQSDQSAHRRLQPNTLAFMLACSSCHELKPLLPLICSMRNARALADLVSGVHTDAAASAMTILANALQSPHMCTLDGVSLHTVVKVASADGRMFSERLDSMSQLCRKQAARALLGLWTGHALTDCTTASSAWHRLKECTAWSLCKFTVQGDKYTCAASCSSLQF